MTIFTRNSKLIHPWWRWSNKNTSSLKLHYRSLSSYVSHYRYIFQTKFVLTTPKSTMPKTVFHFTYFHIKNYPFPKLNGFQTKSKSKQTLCLHNAWARPSWCKGHNPRELISLRMRKQTHVILGANSKKYYDHLQPKAWNITKTMNLDSETIITLIYAFKEW